MTTPFIACGRTERILEMSGRWLITFGHRVLITAMFEMVGQFTPEEGSRTKRTAFVLHVLG